MLHVNTLSYRIQGRLILDGASATLPTGHKVGLVGRNGSGKTTLLKLIVGELVPEGGSLSLPRRARIGTVAQEAPGGAASPLDVVLAADRERGELLTLAESTEDPHHIAEIHTRLSDIDAHSAPARAAIILTGLGLKEREQSAPCSSLSGGWRMRVALAAALFANPDVLLLDEPTNYLDLEGTIWLKNFIRTYRHTVLMVSHDRDLLNDAVEAILHLERGKLTFYSGNYDSFESQRREKQSLIAKFKKKQDDQRRHMMAYVDRFRYKASKARQAQSRLKAIAKLKPVAEMIDEHVAPFRFPNPRAALSPPLIRFENAAVGYEANKPVLKNIDLRIDPDDRIALLGQNGNGKSTFAKLLCRRLQAMGGEMLHHGKLSVGYFAQHQLDELDATLTPYAYFRQLMPGKTESQCRAVLGSYGFGAAIADSSCLTLSGGEKARLLFAIAAFHAPHLLILDEPTNHLDVDAREALVLALNDYEGCVVLVSHDRHLIETTADRLLLVADGTVNPFEGDIEDYTRYVLDGGRVKRREESAEAKSHSPRRSDTAKPVGDLTSARKRIRAIEDGMRALAEKIAVLDRALADGDIYREAPLKAQDFLRLKAKLQTDLEAAESNWLQAQSELESSA